MISFCMGIVGINTRDNWFWLVFYELYSHLVRPYCQEWVVFVTSFSLDEKPCEIAIKCLTVLPSANTFSCIISLQSTG